MNDKKKLIFYLKFLIKACTRYKNFDWSNLFTKEKLRESFLRFLIKKYPEKVQWNIISKYQNLSLSFIEDYQDYLSWQDISMCQRLSEEFMDKFADRLDWKNSSCCQKMSCSFIKKYKHKVDWFSISGYQKLSESFIEEFCDLINFDILLCNKFISNKIKNKYKLILNIL